MIFFSLRRDGEEEGRKEMNRLKEIEREREKREREGGTKKEKFGEEIM